MQTQDSARSFLDPYLNQMDKAMEADWLKCKTAP